MNERDVKLSLAIEELVTAAYDAGYVFACWSDGVPEVLNEDLQKSKDKVEELKKKVFEALNIRIE